jgi:ATP diphosphatase
MSDDRLAADNALTASVAIQGAASALGFDWPDAFGVLAKLEEELGEIREALQAGDRSHAQRELGDLLLAAVNLSRFLGTDPNAELERANARFSRRFAAVQNEVSRAGRPMTSYSLDELDAVWNRVKRALEGD